MDHKDGRPESFKRCVSRQKVVPFAAVSVGDGDFTANVLTQGVLPSSAACGRGGGGGGGGDGGDSGSEGGGGVATLTPCEDTHK